jgi:hypothetical protein
MGTDISTAIPFLKSYFLKTDIYEINQVALKIC